VRQEWHCTRLGEVARFINGRAYKQDELLHAGPYPVLRVGNFFTNRNWYYSDLDLEADKYCGSGDLLYAWSASFGPRIWDGGKVIYHYHIWKIEPDPALIDKRYLFHFLEWDKERIREQQGAGTTMVHVTKGSMENRLIELPSLSEQQRIVAILEEAFAGLATATANAERNLKNARELFDSYFNSIFTAKGKAWAEKVLAEIAEFKNGLNFTKRSKGEKIKIVGVKDFQSNFWIPKEHLDTVQIDGALSDAYLLKRGDILTVRSNGNKQLIGRCILASDVAEKTSHSGFTIRIRVKSAEITPAYLVRYLKSDTIRKMLIESGDGTHISSLNQQALSKLLVFVPPVAEQTEIASRVDDMEAETARLEASYQRKIGALVELKQSILHKTFSGELTSPPSQAIQEAAE
jgi:type I restriction enzyme S subunit